MNRHHTDEQKHFQLKCPDFEKCGPWSIDQLDDIRFLVYQELIERGVKMKKSECEYTALQVVKELLKHS